MKKTVFNILTVMLLLALFSSCEEKEDFNNSIILTDLEIPDLNFETPGTDVTIKGKGFKEGDRLFLSALYISDEKTEEIEATIVSVSSEQLVFTFPKTATNNGYALILKRNGELDVTFGTMKSFEERGWIPDVNLRNALKATFPSVFDAQDSVVLSQAEKVEPTEGTLNISGKGIKSLAGIGYFPRIKTLRATDNSLGEVDLTGCEDLAALFCWNSNVTGWIINNPNLVSFYGGTNPYTSLDLSKAPKVSNLVIDNVPLTHLNISTQKYFDFGNFKFAFTADKNVERTLYINHKFFEDNKLVEKTSPVRTAGLNEVVVSTYNDDGSVNITKVDFGDPEKPDPSGETVTIADAKLKDALKAIYPNIFNDKDEMYIEGAKMQTGELVLNGKGITDMSGLEYFIKITTLKCIDNQISTLNLTGCEALEVVHCWNSNIQNLVINNANLAVLYAGTNPIKDLDLTKAPKMKNIVMDNVPFVTLDIRSNKNIEVPGNCKFDFTDDATQDRILRINHQLFVDKNLKSSELVSKAGLKGVKVITYNDDGTVNTDGVVFP